MTLRYPLVLNGATIQELQTGDTVDVGLGNVNNTSDANKPISTATQTALDLKSPLASPTFTGTVTAPTFIGNLTGTSTGLSTTLVVSSGGTGLTTVGTSGNVLTSNGTTWVSSTPAVGFTTGKAIAMALVFGG